MKKLISAILTVTMLATPLVGSACFADEIIETDYQYIQMATNSIKSALVNITANNTIGANITKSAIANITANNTTGTNTTSCLSDLKNTVVNPAICAIFSALSIKALQRRRPKEMIKAATASAVVAVVAAVALALAGAVAGAGATEEEVLAGATAGAVVGTASAELAEAVAKVLNWLKTAW